MQTIVQNNILHDHMHHQLAIALGRFDNIFHYISLSLHVCMQARILP
jgi:hypothetical protein